MSLKCMPLATAADQHHRICVRIDQEFLGNPTTNSNTKRFTTVSLPISHPVFTTNTVDVLAPFSRRSGGIPLRTFSPSDSITFVAHASEENLSAEQFEVIWQFKLFAQGIHCTVISEEAKVNILTLEGTEEAPRNIVGEFTGEEHYLGWKEEHLKKFTDEYICFSFLQTSDCVKDHGSADFVNLQLPRWLSSAELSAFSQPSVSALDRSLQETISATMNGKTKAKKTFKYGRNSANKARNGKVSRLTDSQSRSVSRRRDWASKNGNLKLSSKKAVRPNNIYGKSAWYHGRKGAGRCKDQNRLIQNRSVLPSANAQLTETNPFQQPAMSLRDANGLSAAICKTTKPYGCISAQPQNRKPLNRSTPLTQSSRDFIAQKIEEMLLIPSQKEAVLHAIRTSSPKAFEERRNGRLIDYRNMSDALYRQLGCLVDEFCRSTMATTVPQQQSSSLDIAATSAQQIPTPEMIQFTRSNLPKLPLERQKELAHIIKKTVPSVDVLPTWISYELRLEEIPIENQIMMWKYVKMHLPKEKDNDAATHVSGEDKKIGRGGAGEASTRLGTNVGSDFVNEDDFEIDLNMEEDDLDIDVDLDYDMGVE
ncbi:hypothetical protein GJ744_011452 [Endocarpon pusillum]|uniref:Uncharacterized protein n=1 Tax=Endocarpon pusillum TaxID=364733 RepID=A0A8H7E3G4_9EURO|nr:hypothetical protein GJ744_011452 [Endocarpon pusillum]